MKITLHGTLSRVYESESLRLVANIKLAAEHLDADLNAYDWQLSRF